jgi:hypothetical protein
MTITSFISFLRQIAAGKVIFHHNFKITKFGGSPLHRGHYVASSYTKEYSKSAYHKIQQKGLTRVHVKF